jgi:hypothetical protein
MTNRRHTLLRRRAGSLVPLPAGQWSAQVPAMAGPGRRGFAARSAAMMDDRTERIGAHAPVSCLPLSDGQIGYSDTLRQVVFRSGDSLTCSGPTALTSGTPSS